MQAIGEEGLTRYDVAVRALAGRDPKLRRLVKNASQFRLKTMLSLFSEIGFKGTELETRARMFLITMSFEDAILERVFVHIVHLEPLATRPL